jgi:ribosomal protein S27E
MVAETLDQVFRIQCANCGKAGSVYASSILAGSAVKCEHCQTPLVVPTNNAAETVREPQPTGSRAPSSTGARALVPTGRLKPVSYIGGTLTSPNVPITANVTPTTPTPPSEPAQKPTRILETAKTEPESEKPNSTTPLATKLSDRVPNEPAESNDSNDSNLARGAREESGRTRTRRRRSSSSGRSWNDIGVDGLPINMEAEATEPEIETAGTRVRDVAGLLVAVAISLMLTQAGLWWVAGIDPLGLAPVISGWIPNVVPQTLVR